TRIGTSLTRELADNDFRRIRIDPQRDAVGALVFVPLRCVVPKGIWILSREQVVAKYTLDPRSVPPLRRVVGDLVSAIEHEQRKIESRKHLSAELGERRVLQSP